MFCLKTNKRHRSYEKINKTTLNCVTTAIMYRNKSCNHVIYTWSNTISWQDLIVQHTVASCAGGTGREIWDWQFPCARMWVKTNC